MEYKTNIEDVNPKNTTRRCPRCGVNNAPNDGTYRCLRCGFEADRQLVGAVNIYMRATGLSPRALDITNLPTRPTILLDEAWVYGYGKHDEHQ